MGASISTTNTILPALGRRRDGHHPILKRDGGKRTRDNTRLEHVRCNNMDFKRHELPEEKRAATVARWRKKYSGESSADA